MTPTKAIARPGVKTKPAKQVKACEVCGNTYDKAFEITTLNGGGRTAHVFDSFECAIHALAPTCAHCGCKIVGHGMESGTDAYCCAHCARAAGHNELIDRSA